MLGQTRLSQDREHGQRRHVRRGLISIEGAVHELL